MRSVYFIGIGGIGMSALARYFKFHGYAVAGSDSMKSAITDSLSKEGVKIVLGHSGARQALLEADLVVYNRAIRPDNPELVAAAKCGIPVVPYAKILGELTKQYTTIAITGSHGKSTTTAFAALALIRGGFDPTVLIGTHLREFGGKNIRMGSDRRDHHNHPNYLVLEADDFGAAFLDYEPAISIVTNIDREHMDFYKTFGGVKRAFLKFMAQTRGGGALILNFDDASLHSLRPQINLIAKKKNLRIIWYSIRRAADATKKIKKSLKLPGDHNLSNATGVYQLGLLLKIPKKKLLAALGSYRGAWRRMEYRGISLMGATKAVVYDDYAHHPTEIRATLQAFREKFPKRPIVCVFQPHQAQRLKLLFKEFIAAFEEADALILIPLYAVAGRDASSKFTSAYLAAAIAKKYPRKKIYYLENPRHIKKALKKIVPPGAVIVMMGAGDIVRYTDLLLG